MEEQHYLQQLAAHLIDLQEQERADILRDFREYFANGYAEGKSAAQIIAALGPAEELAAELLLAYDEQDFVQTVKLEKEQAAPYSKVRVKIDDADVTVRPTDAQEAYVTIQEGQHSVETKLSIQDDTLVVNILNKQWTRKILFFVITGSSGKAVVTLHIPRAHYAHMKIESDNGHLQVMQQQATQFDLYTDNGSIQLHELQGETLQAESDNGRIELHHVHVVDGRIVTDNGRIVAHHSRAKQWYFETDNGRLDIAYVEGAMRGVTDNGRIELLLQSIGAPLDFYTDNGSIKLLTMQMPTDVYIDAATDLGKVTLYNEKRRIYTAGQGAYAVKLRTDLGSIEVDNIV